MQRSETLLKSALFNFFFLIWINSIKNYLRVDLISTCPSTLAKCPFVKWKWLLIETKGPFPTTIWLIFFISNNFLIFSFILFFETFSSHSLQMLYNMRYNDAYAKHVTIGCENKKLNWDVMFWKLYIYAIKATLWIFDAFH